jgi:outer membrane protein assembly factor BamB
MRHTGWGLALLLAGAGAAAAGDWPQFRGPAGDGTAAGAGLPLTWGRDKNVRWKAPLPAPGNSSPVVSRGRVFLTGPTADKQRALFCFDRATGQRLWVRTVPFGGPDPTHDTNPLGSASPAADGERVLAWYGSAGLHCYDYDGNKLWSRDLGRFEHMWGYGSSPVLYRGAALLTCGPGRQQFVTAVDRATGKTLWRRDEPDVPKKGGLPRERQYVGSWSTPVVARVGGKDQVVVSMPHRVVAYDPETGDVLWTCAGLGDLVYTSAVVGGGYGVAMSGYSGPAVGFRVGGRGDITARDRLWRHTAGVPQRIGTGVLLGKHLFLVNEPGSAACLEVETGKELWKARLPGGTVWGSPVCADGRLYVTNKQGTTLVFAPDPAKFTLLAENRLGEPSNSTPAVSDGQIFLRTFKHLWCVESTK